MANTCYAKSTANLKSTFYRRKIHQSSGGPLLDDEVVVPVDVAAHRPEAVGKLLDAAFLLVDVVHEVVEVAVPERHPVLKMVTIFENQ